MVHHLFSRRAAPKPDFPDPRDLPRLTPQEAMAALGLLRLLVDQDVAAVYTAASGIQEDGRYFWNVWLNHPVVPGGKRIPLREWAAAAVCRDDAPTGGDAA
ncbi:MAG TPA: hypothetical protein VH393_03615 [Ktedonobacterales bacterium]|jgi:hypothetical protein